DSGQVSVLTEFCDRGSLRELKDMQAPIPEDIVASVSWQILKGLEYLGANDMMHGNLTLSNVLLTSEGYVKLTDFSVLKRNENPAASSSQLPHPAFISFLLSKAPEAVHGEPVDMKSDIWSLGHVQLELTRTGPVHATALTPFELLTLIADGHVPSLPTGQFSEEFEDVSRKCLEMNPENRASVQELLDHVWCR
ncbi:kinase-like domain-containing protein, partial [Chytriomyces sp. MP71]